MTSGGIPEDAVELLVLDQLPGVGPVTVRRLVRAFGSPQAALIAPSDVFSRIAPGGAAVARSEKSRVAGATAQLEKAVGQGCTITTWRCPAYPPDLHQLADPPPLLFLQGRTSLLSSRGVAVVGARHATQRARGTAERLGIALGRKGVPVVSGLALGVDGAVHVGALRVDGDTIAVLGSGTDVDYPRSHRRIQKSIRERGLLVSEFPPGTEAAPHHFPRRNRILAALASTVVVVEAAKKSGALITVDHALDLGREVWAVPGPIDSAPCVGSNRLLADGARPLVSISDFVSRIPASEGNEATGQRRLDFGEGVEGDGADMAAASAPDHRADCDSLDVQVLTALSDGPLQVDELAVRLGRPVGQILAQLTTLELFGEVERVPGMRFRRAA